MKFCDKCGYALKDEEKYCPSCGADTSVSKTKPKTIMSKVKLLFSKNKKPNTTNKIQTTQNITNNVYAINREYNLSRTYADLESAAHFFMVLSCLAYLLVAIIMFICSYTLEFSKINALLCLIPLVWCLPMTISYSKKTYNSEYVGVRFKINILLFVNFIAGILALCDNSN